MPRMLALVVNIWRGGQFSPGSGRVTRITWGAPRRTRTALDAGETTLAYGTRREEEPEMSRQDLTKVVQRSISDPAFRTQLATNAGAALRGYDLTPDEVSALRSRDGGKLTSFGIDQRMSKIFIDPG